MGTRQERLDELARKGFWAHEDRLRNWAEAAEEELQEEEPSEQIYGLLLWAQIEFGRRRAYLNMEMPELERHAAALLRALGAQAVAQEGKWRR